MCGTGVGTYRTGKGTYGTGVNPKGWSKLMGMRPGGCCWIADASKGSDAGSPFEGTPFDPSAVNLSGSLPPHL